MSRVADRIRNLPSGGHADAVSRFTQRAIEEGSAQVGYSAVESPIGDLTALVTSQGLLALAFETDDLDRIMETVAAKVSPRIIRTPSAIERVRSWLDAYFGGRSVPDLSVDRSLITPFQDRVLVATAGIPPGEVRTYGQVAALAGNPKAARATGRALGANPIPVVLPCHRVVAADGSLHGYAGGLDRKRLLLDHERAMSGMKFLFDQNLSPKLEDELRDLFPGSVHINHVGLQNADDPAIWEYARSRAFAIASTDSDFRTLSRKLGHPPKVVWIQPGNLKPQEIVRMLHEKHHDLLAFHKNDVDLFELS